MKNRFGIFWTSVLLLITGCTGRTITPLPSVTVITQASLTSIATHPSPTIILLTATPSPTATNTPTNNTSSKSIPTSTNAPTPSIAPVSVNKIEIHSLALNEHNIYRIKNLVTIGTPKKYCVVSSSLDTALETRFVNNQTVYLLATTELESGNIRIWNLNTEKITQTLQTTDVDSVLFHPDHKILISFSRDSGTIILWDVDSGNKRYEFNLYADYYNGEQINVSQDGLIITLFSIPYNPSTIQLSELNLQNGQVSNAYYDFSFYVEPLPPYFGETLPPHIYSPKGSLIAITYGGDNKLHLINLTNRNDTTLQFPYRNRDEIIREDAIISTISIDSNEKYVVGGAKNGDIYIWNVSDGSLIKSFKSHKLKQTDGWMGGIKILEFSPSTNLLLSVGYDGYTKLWDVTNGVLLKEIKTCHHFGGFTQDGRYLVTVGENGIEIWGIP